MERKPRILILCDYYLPGYKSGGGMRTIVNMVERLKDRFDFWVITRDHDGKEDKKPYTTVKINDWNSVEGAQVFYLSKNKVRISKIRQLISEVKPDSIYTNSYFATPAILLLMLRRLGLIPESKVILAPCGELSEGALQLKPFKKKLFIGFSKISELYTDIIWKASNDFEKAEIELVKGAGGEIHIAPDLPPRTILSDYRQELKPSKKRGEARMVFLSRFMRKKNFRWLLEFIGQVEGNLTIDIYGPIEDEGYWAECQKIIKKLPENIKVEAKGSIPHEKAAATLFEYHFFILPTIGENFGHVFLEALAAGCPLIISDRTPWLNLQEDGIGWALSLEDKNEWLKTINFCINLDDANFAKMSVKARDYVCKWLSLPETEESTLRVLNASLDNALNISRN
jgi:glycosyltransferase involved in cell wall biosynthesis